MVLAIYIAVKNSLIRVHTMVKNTNLDKSMFLIKDLLLSGYKREAADIKNLKEKVYGHNGLL